MGIHWKVHESSLIAFCNQMVAPWKFSSSTELQNSSSAWYLSFILNPNQDFNLWRQIGHENIGRLLDSWRWLLPFIAHEKNTQCFKANKWHISWAMTYKNKTKASITLSPMRYCCPIKIFTLFLLYCPLTPVSELKRLCPHNIRQKSDENKENYKIIQIVRAL